MRNNENRISSLQKKITNPSYIYVHKFSLIHSWGKSHFGIFSLIILLYILIIENEDENENGAMVP